nr:MAG TPA: hypothetical protein [Caudoviricetes sp.]
MSLSLLQAHNAKKHLLDINILCFLVLKVKKNVE